MAGSYKKLQTWWRDRKGGERGARARSGRPDAAPAASSASKPSSSDIQTERSEDSAASVVNHQDPPVTESLWDRAYDALAKKNAELVKDYESLLTKEEQMAKSASDDELSPAQPMSLHDVTSGPDRPLRQAQLNTVINQGLRRMEEAKPTYTIAGHDFVLADQITQAAKLLLWAKDWIGAAVHASPEASIAWTGVCLILPLLTNPTTAAEASRDGFADVTARMRYYVALEPLLRRLGQSAGVADTLMAEANNHIVDLYQHILEFQLCSVLRFYQSRRRTYVHDMFSTKDWKQTTLDIRAREDVVNRDLGQINALAARQELELLNKTSTDALGAMEGFLSVSTQQLAVLQEQLVMQQDAAQQKLSDEQKECLQLFCHTKNDNDTTYDWYKGRVEDRVEGTCQWLLQHDHFKRWWAQESGPLLVSADPGCGKSVLAKYLIDQELPQQSATVCYFFFKDQDQNTCRQALCAVLHQLFSQKRCLIQHAMELYNARGPALAQSDESLWTILRDAVRDPQAGPVTIVLDALDECAESELKDLIQKVEQLLRDTASTNAKLKFLLTSRPYEQILHEFWSLLEAFPHIHIPGEDEVGTISQEINRVIQHRVEQLARKQRLSDKVKSALEARLLGIEHRTYLWVYLVFDYLDTGFQKTTKGVEAATQNLPTSVNQAYERILDRSKEDPMVRKVLSVILAACRPLTLSEMNIAININGPGQSFRDLELEEEADFKSRLRTWCGLFVSIHHGRVYFLHQTAREFLTESPSPTAVSSELRWHHSITRRHAHTVLAEICVVYLRMFDSNEHETSSHGHESIGFLDYATRNWFIHLRDADIEHTSVIASLALGLCEPHSTSYSLWCDVYRMTESNTQLTDKYFKGLFLTSCLGLKCVAQLMLNKGATIDLYDDRYKTPLSYAAEKGYEAVVQLLLDHGASATLTAPLAYAACQGHEAIVRLLLDKGGDVNKKGEICASPLPGAVCIGHEGIVRMLLDKDPDLDVRTYDDVSPLHYASKRGYKGIVRMLLDKGADMKVKNNDGETPLFHACRNGWEGIVRMLLDHGADVEVRGRFSDTPLSFASSTGHEGIMRILLNHGADVEVKDKDGQTPLSFASYKGYEGIIRMLLDHGADVEVRNELGETPLSFASYKGHEGIVRMLLDRGADVKVRNEYGQTPLRLASSEGHEGIVRMLLDHGADVKVRDRFSDTPLSLASFYGHKGIVRMLLDHGADVKVRNASGRTPLSLASFKGHEGIVRMLLDHGADVKVRDRVGRTPLRYASFYGHKGIVRMLLDKGA